MTDITDEVAQTNNALIYPALGLGAILARSNTISPSMLMAGVHALASLSPALHNPEASLLPDLADVRKVSVDVAAAVVRQAVEDGNATDQQTIDVVQGKGPQGLEDYIRVRTLLSIIVKRRTLTGTEPYVGRRVQAAPIGRLEVDSCIVLVFEFTHLAWISYYASLGDMQHLSNHTVTYQSKPTVQSYSPKISFSPFIIYFFFIPDYLFVYWITIPLVPMATITTCSRLPIKSQTIPRRPLPSQAGMAPAKTL